MLPICYGALALKPWEIDKLTPGEILDMHDGWLVRRRRTEELLAQFVTIPIYNHQRGKKDKKVTLKDIFGHEEYIKRFGQPDKPSEEEIHNEFFD